MTITGMIIITLTILITTMNTIIMIIVTHTHKQGLMDFLRTEKSVVIFIDIS